MKFINKNKKEIKVRVGNRFKFSWISVKPGEEIDFLENKGERDGFEKVNKVTEGKIGKTKVETKQFEKEVSFWNELLKIKGIGLNTAKDIVNVFKSKKDIIKAIKSKQHLPFRNDIEKKLRKKYG